MSLVLLALLALLAFLPHLAYSFVACRRPWCAVLFDRSTRELLAEKRRCYAVLFAVSLRLRATRRPLIINHCRVRDTSCVCSLSDSL